MDHALIRHVATTYPMPTTTIKELYFYEQILDGGKAASGARGGFSRRVCRLAKWTMSEHDGDTCGRATGS